MAKHKIPEFKTDEEGAEFWDSHDFMDYIGDTEPETDLYFTLKPLKQVCLRLSETQIARLKRTAAAKGIGYQTMIRMWITEREREEAA